jgi:hypothetical protein
MRSMAAGLYSACRSSLPFAMALVIGQWFYIPNFGLRRRPTGDNYFFNRVNYLILIGFASRINVILFHLVSLFID